MASTSQSLRYIGPPASGAGGGSFDALNRILADLCTHGNPKVCYFSVYFPRKLLKMLNYIVLVGSGAATGGL